MIPITPIEWWQHRSDLYSLKSTEFSLAVYCSIDGGQTWTETPSLELSDGWDGTSDPAVAWDNKGNTYLVALPFKNNPNNPCATNLLGIAVYQSKDGGKTWGSPNLIHKSEDTGGDDKQWVIGDGDPNSPHYGNVYTAWDGGGIGGANLRFARTTDNGITWKGVKVDGVDKPAGTALFDETATDGKISDSGSPEFAVATDGTLYVVWTSEHTIKFVKSVDGGDSFSQPAIVARIKKTFDDSGLPTTNSCGFDMPHFGNASFRIETFATICTGLNNNVVVAWPDMREGVSRIYYRYSTNGGKTWMGTSPNGQPLLTGSSQSDSRQHDFFPQTY